MATPRQLEEIIRIGFLMFAALLCFAMGSFAIAAGATIKPSSGSYMLIGMGVLFFLSSVFSLGVSTLALFSHFNGLRRPAFKPLILKGVKP